MAELEAQVGSAEAVDGDGQLHHLAPAGAVVVVQHEGAILREAGLPRSQADAVLQGGQCVQMYTPIHPKQSYQVFLYKHKSKELPLPQ